MILQRCIIPWGYKYLRPSVADPFGSPRTPELIVSIGIAIILTGIMGYLVKRAQYSEWKFPTYTANIIGVLLIVLSLYMDGKFYYQWVRSPEYTVSETGKDIMAYVGSNGYIGGMDAPGVAYDTPYKTLISWDQYVNYAENPITKYQLTHLFLANNQNIQETRYYFDRYPQEIQTATLLQQYTVKNTEFHLFSLVEPKIEEILIEKTTFPIQEPLHVKMRVKNHDFRQSRKIYLNWFLYPMELDQNGNPASLGQEQQGWLAPEQEQELIVSGKLPDRPGQYALLGSLQAVNNHTYQAEEMQHQIGVIIRDIDAMGSQVVYHDVTAFPVTGFLTYGLYRSYQPGVYEANFRLKTGDKTTTDMIARIEVVADYGREIITTQELRETDFFEPHTYQNVILPYKLNDTTHNVEFRVFSYGTAEIWVDEIRVNFQEGRWYSDTITLSNQE
jgi:hypothetical protein